MGGPPGLLVQRLRGMGRDRIFEGVEPGNIMTASRLVQHEPHVAVADERQHLRCRFGDSRRGNQHPSAAVVDDVGGFVRGQVPVDRREVQAAAHRGPVRVEVADVVVGEDRHVVARAQAGGPHELRELAAARFELAEGPDPAVAGHDHCWTVWIGGGVPARITHGRRS